MERLLLQRCGLRRMLQPLENAFPAVVIDLHVLPVAGVLMKTSSPVELPQANVVLSVERQILVGQCFIRVGVLVWPA